MRTCGTAAFLLRYRVPIRSTLVHVLQQLHQIDRPRRWHRRVHSFCKGRAVVALGRLMSSMLLALEPIAWRCKLACLHPS
ncbi:hypothetical protein F2Q68_00011088 [Brassica cretica]|uniref:Uncharacterized protein n=1 Tax=Brassica cretica TaxID=69181 RepID=A0A8S9KWZ5_BRACR|nr:hypothetical protein F2Q68_00011088 [Brassica cretica]